MSAELRVLDVPAEGPCALVASAGAAAPPPPGTVRWIDLRAQDEASLKLLADRFGFHPLTIEDCLHVDQRPKLEEYGDYLFVVIHGFSCPSGKPDQMMAHELHAFLGANYLVTVHEDPIEPLEKVWQRAAGEPVLGRRGPDFLLYLVADAVVDANFPILDVVADALEEIEDAVLERARRADLQRIFSLKRTLVEMRKVLSPQRDVFSLLSKRGDPRVSEKTSLYFRDIYDHLYRIAESIEAARDLLGNALDAYLSMSANRTNEIMKRLTLLSAVFLPLTFITGFFGQNFDHLPFHSDLFMYSMIATCGLIPTAMVLLFKRSGWFD
jgi:magnesium transporter